MPNAALDTSGKDSFTGNTKTFTAVTNNNNELLIVWIMSSNSASTLPTVNTPTASGLTFQKVITDVTNSPSSNVCRMTCWAAFVATANATISVSVTTSNNTNATIVWASMTGLDVTGSLNPERFIGSVIASTQNSVTQFGFATYTPRNINSMVIGVMGCQNTGRSFTQNTGVILQDQDIGGTVAAHQVLMNNTTLSSSRNSSTAGLQATANFGSNFGGVMALEIMGASGGYCYKRNLFTKADSNKSTVTTAISAFPVPSGTSILVAVYFDLASSTGVTVSSITDDAGNTYALDKAQSNTSGNMRVEIWSAQNITDLAASANINVIFSGTVVNSIKISADSAYKIKTSSYLDGTSSNTGSDFSSSTVTVGSGNITTTNANDLLYGCGGIGSTSNITTNAAWNEIVKNATGKTDSVGYRTDEATETRAYQFSIFNQQYVAAISSYKENTTVIAQTTAATIATLEGNKVTTAAMLTTLQGNKAENVSLLATLEQNADKNIALISTLEKVVKRTTAILTTLDANKAENTAVFTIFEKILHSTLGMITTLESLNYDNVAILTTLERLQNLTTGVLSTLEGNTVENTAVLSTLEKVIYENIALNTELEGDKITTAAVNAQLEDVKVTTASILTNLEVLAYSTTGILTTLEKLINFTLGISTTLEQIELEVLAINTYLERNSVDVIALNTFLEGNKAETIAIKTNLIEPPLTYRQNYVRNIKDKNDARFSKKQSDGSFKDINDVRF